MARKDIIMLQPEGVKEAARYQESAGWSNKAD